MVPLELLVKREEVYTCVVQVCSAPASLNFTLSVDKNSFRWWLSETNVIRACIAINLFRLTVSSSDDEGRDVNAHFSAMIGNKGIREDRRSADDIDSDEEGDEFVVGACIPGALDGWIPPAALKILKDTSQSMMRH